MPNFIGQIVISLAFLVFINYIYKSLPISFIDNLYYLKIFYFLGFICTVYQTFSYLFQALFFYYCRYNINVNISKKIPVRLYNLLNDIKIVSQIKEFGSGIFVIHFFMYLALSILLISLMFII